MKGSNILFLWITVAPISKIWFEHTRFKQVYKKHLVQKAVSDGWRKDAELEINILKMIHCIVAG
jgi:hypothetical protein